MVKKMAQTKKWYTTEQGFTLIELLVSISILSIVAVVFFSFFTQASLSNQKADTQVAAVNVAERVLNDIKSSGPALGCDESQLGYENDGKGFYIVNGKEKYYVSVTCDDTYDVNGLMLVETVLYDDEDRELVTMYDYFIDWEEE
ncbi:PulJ/GspJ family protein [Alteribacter keqinensis]|nr:prepilin-type N-terminal cleavage/methylation domain-containing protein [Alteribacter keqinensis]